MWLTEERPIYIFEMQQGDMEYHSHDFLELVYISEGRAMHWLDGEKSTVNEGDYFIIDYGSEHKYKNFDGEHFKLINCLFRPSFIDPVLKNCRSFGELLSTYQIRLGGSVFTHPPTRHTFSDRDGEVRLLFEKLKAEFENRKTGWEEIVRCRLIETLILMLRGIVAGSRPKDKNVAFAMKFAEEHFTEKIGISDAAAMRGISPQYLSARFREESGMTFTEYVQRLRIGTACRLLSETDKKITEIAELSGYGDIKFFNAVFKRTAGVAPGEFRRLGNA